MQPRRLPTSSADQYNQQKRLAALTLAAAHQAWAQMDPANFDAAWSNVGARILLLLTIAQQQSAQNGANYVAELLAEMGITAPTTGFVQANAFAGIASSGGSLADALYDVVIDAKVRVAAGMTGRQALTASMSLLDGIVTTQVADAGRVATGVAITSRPEISGYVRMLNPPSCARCVVLAGKFYRWNQGFQRHPRCDCIHIPAAEDTKNDPRTDPRAYFESLTREEQDAQYTAAGAHAIRDGADISQVVNTRRRASGISTAAGLHYTTAGAGKRGRRLMPESIYQVAQNRDDAIRLLKVNGYLI